MKRRRGHTPSVNDGILNRPVGELSFPDTGPDPFRGSHQEVRMTTVVGSLHTSDIVVRIIIIKVETINLRVKHGR